MEDTKKKRGRSKKIVQVETAAQVAQAAQAVAAVQAESSQTTLEQVAQAETNIDKNETPIENATPITQVENEQVENDDALENDDDSKKKRGRKPKRGKITVKQIETTTSTTPIANIILHLKCHMSDLIDYNNSQIVKDPYEYIPVVPTNVIMTYNDEKSFNNFGIYEASTMKQATAYQDDISGEESKNQEGLAAGSGSGSESRSGSNGLVSNTPQKSSKQNIYTTNTIFCPNCIDNVEHNDNLFIRDINNKLKKLKIQLYKNAIPDKKSSCFWCTYDFDNQACYIPKYEMDGSIFGYGSFCRPECAVAYLMRENIDDSTKFERYHLLNQIYSKVYGFKKNIKPAPNPYYMLEKYYGNLTIQEYRKLLKTEHMMLVIDKPMTRILPELHEDNEDLMANINGGKIAASNTNGVYKVKRQCDKQEGPSKSSIMKNKFGL